MRLFIIILLLLDELLAKYIHIMMYKLKYTDFVRIHETFRVFFQVVTKIKQVHIFLNDRYNLTAVHKLYMCVCV